MFTKLTLLASCLATVFGISNFPLLLIISFDGFRYNYFDKVPTPNFIRFRETGVYVREMKNVYVTQTFPNHFSIATGRYVEDHGVVGNTAYDPLLKKKLDFSTPELFNYDESVMPLWSLNEMQEGRHSGTMMWVGGEHAINKVSNTYAVKLDKKVSLNKRLDIALGWFTDKDKPANVVFLYYEEPDSSGHWFGPDSKELKDKLTEADKFVEYLVDSVRKNGLSDSLNIILTTDHGMTNTKKQLIKIKDLKNEKMEFYGDSPLIEVKVKAEADILEIYDLFKSNEKGKHYKTYLKKDFPDEYHFKNNRRVQDILLRADYGYDFDVEGRLPGNHGYDNKQSEMHGFLMATGPAFKTNFTVTGDFINLDIYPTACQILGLKPYPNNGTIRFEMLKEETFNDLPLILGILFGILAAVVLCIASVVGIKKWKSRQQQTVSLAD